MNPFSGSANLWRLLGEYEPLNVLWWYCKGPLCGSYGPKIGQNCMKYVILVTFGIFSLQKRLKLIHFLLVLFYGLIWENISSLTYFFGSVRGFYMGHIVQNLVKITWNMTFWALFEHFYFKKDRNESIFWWYYFVETFVRIWALKCSLSVLQGPSEWVLWSQNWPKLHAIWPLGTYCISPLHES